ncbi:hypothetical protein LZL87_003532 [Fusarium oxysporum]|nr:hypothetical protein LZL87_003532 [Fusarium oxysporum]
MVTLRSHTLEKTRRWSWAFLPQEIRRMILEEISRQRRWGCASAVCKEWHALIAPKNLNRLELNRASAEGLTTIILEALRKLSEALAAWEPTDHITLELNVYSPSDPENWFKNHLYGFKHEDDGNLLEKQKTWDDPKQGWIKGKQVVLPKAAAIQQLFKAVISEVSGVKTPQVPAVKGIVIRRQMRRRIDPLTLSNLLRQFPIVESINYEPWRVLFHRLDLNGSIYGRHGHSCASRTAPARQISDLEHLSVSFMIDARDFSRSFKMFSDSARLRSLMLTTPLMTKGSRGRISDLLVNTGQVAQKMQYLKSLAIWHCSHDEASAVVFHKNEKGDRKEHGSATLTWRGTRDFDFSKEVVETWQKVVCTCNSHRGYVGQCDSHQLLCRIERVEGEIISHGDAIHHLRLPDGVIDPTSLRQIRKEGILQREAWAVEAEPGGWT